jgi:hypothetical protein
MRKERKKNEEQIKKKMSLKYWVLWYYYIRKLYFWVFEQKRSLVHYFILQLCFLNIGISSFTFHTQYFFKHNTPLTLTLSLYKLSPILGIRTGQQCCLITKNKTSFIPQLIQFTDGLIISYKCVCLNSE